MSTEDKLRVLFRQDASWRTAPAEADARVMAAYRAYRRHGGSRRAAARRFPGWGAAALVALLLSGFALGGTLLYEYRAGSFAVRTTAVSGLEMDPAQRDAVYRILADVREELQPGQQAVVYVSEASGLLPAGFPPLLPVSKPAVERDWAAWSGEVAAATGGVTVPAALAGGYAFEGGHRGMPFGGSIGTGDRALADELAREAAGKNAAYAWRLASAPAEPAPALFTTVYRRASSGAALYLTVERLEESAASKFEMRAPTTTEYERLELNGTRADYIENDRFLFSASGHYRFVEWIEADEGGTALYQLGSDSAEVAKERLIDAATAVRNAAEAR